MCRCRFSFPIIVVLLLAATEGVFAFGGTARDPMQMFIQFALYMPALLLGIGFHEFAHAYVAVRLGDPTPEDAGRVSLNPLDHLDPMGTILIVFAVTTGVPIIGWGLPVPVTGSAFRNPIRDMMKVAIAGPLMNLAVAAGGAALFLVCTTLDLENGLGLPAQAASRVYRMLYAIVLTNFSLALFNLLPIPPLDGNWIAREYLDADKTEILAKMEPYGFLLLLLMIQTPILDAPFRYARFVADMIISSWAAWAGFSVLVAVLWSILLRSLPWFHFRRSD